MKSIFNSLGSNYSIKFVYTSLFSILNSKKSDLILLENFLSKTYEGEALTLYKGRDAIEASCRVLLDKKSKVITQAFSCSAVEEGIVRAGMHAVYADIGVSTNLNIATLKSVFKKHPDAKAVLVQHSLGVAADIKEIQRWCKQNGMFLIEDVAQGIGGVDEVDNLLGANADAVVFSFGRDKITDAVSGGAVVFRNMDDEREKRLLDVKAEIKKLPFHFVYYDLIYPNITSLIRRTHHIVIGKIILLVCKYLGMLDSPVKSKVDYMTWMHPAYAKLALLQFKDLEKQIAHRKKMSTEYFNCFNGSEIVALINKEQINQSSNLRFSIRCKDNKQVNQFITVLKNNNVYVSDRWYRSAVDCGNFDLNTSYKKGSCPNAELLATQVLNLPTHREINSQKVKKICKILLNLLEKQTN
jgi:perosamine synthetase